MAQGKERRKMGRPIMHKGDPNDPGLAEKERRRIKRRIANRESARRVTYRRQEEMEDMQIRVSMVKSGRGEVHVCVFSHHLSIVNMCNHGTSQ